MARKSRRGDNSPWHLRVRVRGRQRRPSRYHHEECFLLDRKAKNKAAVGAVYACVVERRVSSQEGRDALLKCAGIEKTRNIDASNSLSCIIAATPPVPWIACVCGTFAINVVGQYIIYGAQMVPISVWKLDSTTHTSALLQILYTCFFVSFFVSLGTISKSKRACNEGRAPRVALCKDEEETAYATREPIRQYSTCSAPPDEERFAASALTPRLLGRMSLRALFALEFCFRRWGMCGGAFLTSVFFCIIFTAPPLLVLLAFGVARGSFWPFTILKALEASLQGFCTRFCGLQEQHPQNQKGFLNLNEVDEWALFLNLNKYLTK